jgi:hypothetical protein
MLGLANDFIVSCFFTCKNLGKPSRVIEFLVNFIGMPDKKA